MRICGGRAKGIPLKVSKFSQLRPATEANRERLFSFLGDLVKKSNVLDLFAGSGSYGLEALSRGAAQSKFVEKNRTIVGDLNYNVQKVCKSAGLPSMVAQTCQRDVLEFLKIKSSSYDLIFLDPPFADHIRLGSIIFQLLHDNDFAHYETLLIFESPAENFSTFPNWKMKKTLGKPKKGSPVLQIYELERKSILQGRS